MPRGAQRGSHTRAGLSHAELLRAPLGRGGDREHAVPEPLLIVCNGRSVANAIAKLRA